MSKPIVIRGRFGRRTQSPQQQAVTGPEHFQAANRRDSRDRASLDILASELINLYGELPLDGRLRIETRQGEKAPQLVIHSSNGVLLTVEINPESGCFVMSECLASDDWVVITASIERLIDHVVSQISRRLDDLAPQVVDNAIDVLVGCSIAETERRLILRTLHFYKGDRGQSAFALDIPVEELGSKLRGYLMSVTYLRSGH